MFFVLVHLRSIANIIIISVLNLNNNIIMMLGEYNIIIHGLIPIGRFGGFVSRISIIRSIDETVIPRMM